MHRAGVLALAVCLLPAAARAQADANEAGQIRDQPQDQVRNLPEVTVVAPTPVPGLTVSRDAFPANVQTATDADIERTKAANLTGFLAETMTGVIANDSQGNPFEQDLLYRGYRLSPLLGTPQGLSLYLDGVRQNAALGDVVNWSGIPEAAIASITLVPGSNPLYGLNTLGGAIALVTKSGETHEGVEADLSIGSYGRQRFDLSAGKQLGDGWHAFVAGTGWHENGWRDASPSELGNLFFKLGRSTTDTQWNISLLGSTSRLTGNGLTPDSLYAVNPASLYTSPDVTRVHSLQVALSGTHQFNAADQLGMTLYVRRALSYVKSGDTNDDYVALLLGCQPGGGNCDDDTPPAGVMNASTTRETSYGVSAQWSHDGDMHHFGLGASLDWTRANYTQTTQDASFGAARNAVVDPSAPEVTQASLQGNDTTLGLFATDTIQLFPQTWLTAAARWNDSRKHTVLTLPTQSDESFTFSKLNPSLGLTQGLGGGVTLFGSASQGTRMPTAIELGCADPANACQLPTGLQADPFLRQVVSRTIEMGARWRPADATEVSLALYRANNRDDILFQRSPVNQLGFFTNFPQTRNEGVELGARHRFGRLSVRAGYSYTHATYQADGALQTPFAAPVIVRPGTRMAGIPLHAFKLGGDWRATPTISVGGDMITTSSRPVAGNEDGALTALDPGFAHVGGFTVFNLRASWQVAPRWQLYGRIDNVFDRRYETYGQSGFNLFPGGTLLQPGGAVPVERFVAPGAPRLFLVGVRYEWDGKSH